MPLPSALGPQCVGLRVVVRRRLPGLTGPTGGPAMTDVLGVMAEWTEESTTVVAPDGTRTVIALADIVSGKPVPPRPSVRLRIDADELDRRLAETWPPVEAEPLGEWVLRHSGGFMARGSSALLAGDPGTDLDAALQRVREFYRDRGARPVVQVPVGDLCAAVEARGWAHLRADEGDAAVYVAGTATASRALRGLAPVPGDAVVQTELPADWLERDPRIAAHHIDARALLEGPAQRAFVTTAHAKGRVALSDRDPSFAGVSDLATEPRERRRGHGTGVLRALVEWAAERGATTVGLQVVHDNAAAVALYERVGFVEHHRVRFLAAPGE